MYIEQFQDKIDIPDEAKLKPFAVYLLIVLHSTHCKYSIDVSNNRNIALTSITVLYALDVHVPRCIVCV